MIGFDVFNVKELDETFDKFCIDGSVDGAMTIGFWDITSGYIIECITWVKVTIKMEEMITILKLKILILLCSKFIYIFIYKLKLRFS